MKSVLEQNRAKLAKLALKHFQINVICSSKAVAAAIYLPTGPAGNVGVWNVSPIGGQFWLLRRIARRLVYSEPEKRQRLTEPENTTWQNFAEQRSSSSGFNLKTSNGDELLQLRATDQRYDLT